MDLRLLLAEPSEAERQALDAVVGAGAAPSGHAAADRRQLLLPALRAVQRRVGWVSEGALNEICRRLDVPPADAYGVATFYHLLSLEPRPERAVHVCDDVVCRLAGGNELVEALGEVAERSPCLGLCDRAPAALVTVAGEAPAEWGVAPAAADSLEQSGATVVGGERRLLRRVGLVDPERLEAYEANGGLSALRRAFELGPGGVVGAVTEARLLGRGGAAFPTGRKWEAVAASRVGPHYLVCNADESEPGTFKDRVLLEEDPFAVLEAMAIAAFATGCERGFLYVRGEYPLARARLENAVALSRAGGLLGGDVLGMGVSFDVELRVGAGAYVCGEETALFESIEGGRGEPRNKPPFPVEAGLFGRPTVVNNVETLANLLPILLDGPAAYAATGTEASTGTRLFCLSGHVERPGLYEVPMGTPLRDLLDLAGGVGGGRRLQAVLLGGAAGTFLRPDELEVPLSFEGVLEIGATLGSGAVVVFDETADLRDTVLRIAAFFRAESCGQCVPCRVGTVRQEEALQRLVAGSDGADRALLTELGAAMRDASICGLGQTAANAVLSAVDHLGVFENGAAA